MIDLSNNNGAVSFRRVHQAGQRRVYLKRGGSEGSSGWYTDTTYPGLRDRAHVAGLLTGAYWFAHPGRHSPREEADHFLRLLGEIGQKDLRPAIDAEYGTPDQDAARWYQAFAKTLHAELGYKPVFYSFPWYLEQLALSFEPGPLWLASFGRNDGREHPYSVPKPWTKLAAHQYSSNARVAGVTGLVDISHVYDFDALAIPAPPH